MKRDGRRRVHRLADSVHGLLLIGTGAGALFAVSVLAGSIVLARVGRPMEARLPEPRPAPASSPPAVPPAVPAGDRAPVLTPASFERRLLRPVDVSDGALRDSFLEARRGRPHGAVDIVAPRGTAVRAVDDGSVLRLARGATGGITVEHLDPTGRYCYYYAHLAGYRLGLAAGQRLTRGQVIGYVGTTGNAPPQAPHLHFAIFRTNGPVRACAGTPVNPFPLLR